MIQLLFSLYKTNINKKIFIKERIIIGWWGWLVLLFELGVAIYAIIEEIDLLYGASILLIVVTTYWITKYIDKRYYPNLAIEKYNEKVDALKNLLFKCNIRYNRSKKISYIIELMDNELKNLKISNRIYKTLRAGFGIIVPVVSWLVRSNSDLSKLLIDNAIWVIIVLFQSLGLFIILFPFIEDMLDSDYNKMKELQSLLKDIYYLDL